MTPRVYTSRGPGPWVPQIDLQCSSRSKCRHLRADETVDSDPAAGARCYGQWYHAKGRMRGVYGRRKVIKGMVPCSDPGNKAYWS
jgi:hypothetical protein